MDSWSTSIGFVGTYPPQVCGIASYTASLVQATPGSRSGRNRVGVVSLNDRQVGLTGPPVVFTHLVGDRASRRTAVRILNSYDTVSIQHEFGIFGGLDGVEVIDFLSELTVPTAVTLHTVLREPSPHQRAITEGICELAQHVVVMSRTASNRLISGYEADPARLTVIPHGVDKMFAGPSLTRGKRPLVLTWGLIGPGKGLEWAIESFAGLRHLRPLPRYLIAGATHPNVRRDRGETYRDGLQSLTERLGANDLIEFDNRYFDREALARLVRSADLVLLPYQSAEQVTSGVLVEALAASKPVVASPFPHAVELLSGGAGAIVPHGNIGALRLTLGQLLTDPGAMSLMTNRAHRLAGDWYWPTIGRRFTALMTRLAQADAIRRPLVLDGRLVAG